MGSCFSNYRYRRVSESTWPQATEALPYESPGSVYYSFDEVPPNKKKNEKGCFSSWFSEWRRDRICLCG
jgi:hypothetical protein